MARVVRDLAAEIAERRAEAARILRVVAELFSTPGAWTQHSWARDAGGMSLARALDSKATCWCLLGAIRKVRGPGMSPAEDAARSALYEVLQLRGGETIAGWNDHPGRDVSDVRRAAIAGAERLEAMS